VVGVTAGAAADAELEGVGPLVGPDAESGGWVDRFNRSHPTIISPATAVAAIHRV
jgi:hypothetical protein